ncbi:unnamed protein product [Amoebophrya sp. A25]|nr:unnamed protein product [Amoebophrya sp. A25]|eukprot:GSA25T00015036001.1
MVRHGHQDQQLLTQKIRVEPCTRHGNRDNDIHVICLGCRGPASEVWTACGARTATKSYQQGCQCIAGGCSALYVVVCCCVCSGDSIMLELSCCCTRKRHFFTYLSCAISAICYVITYVEVTHWRLFIWDLNPSQSNPRESTSHLL